MNSIVDTQLLGVQNASQRLAPDLVHRVALPIMQTTTERLARLETAQELIGLLIGVHSSASEAAFGAVPRDVAAVEREDAAVSSLSRELDSLRLGDDANIERVIATYGPMVRAEYAR